MGHIAGTTRGRWRRAWPAPLLVSVAVAAVAAGGAVAEEPPVTTAFRLAPEWSSGDRSFKVRGRLQLDAAVADADLDGFSDSWSGSELRRGRLGVQGRDGRIGYVAELTLGEGEAVWEDAFITLDFESFDVIAGHWKTPVSLEGQSSSRHTSALEKASITSAFNLGRRLGVGVIMNRARTTFRAGVFGDNANADTGASSEGVAAAARVTFNPDVADGRIVHLGASVQHREANDGGLFDYAQRPMIHISDAFVDTGAFAESDTFLGAEAALIAGPAHVAAEFGVLDADGVAADGAFQGGYVEGGFFLTQGDSRGYGGGVFDRVRPVRSFNAGGMGAWQLRGRLDWIDLEDGAIAGGAQTSFTGGLNWYLTDYVRMLGEYTFSDIEDGPAGSGEVNALSVRAQIDW